jgi:hypothetical protein
MRRKEQENMNHGGTEKRNTRIEPQRHRDTEKMRGRKGVFEPWRYGE